MKMQNANDRMDESLSMRDGKESTKEQSFKDRRDESRAMSRKQHGMRGGSTFGQVFSNMQAVNRAGHKSPNQVME